MLFFFHVGADGRVNWWIPFVMFVVTVIFPSLLDIPFFGASPPPPPLRQQDPVNDAPADAPWYENHWLWTPLLPIIACGIPAIIFYFSFTLLFERWSLRDMLTEIMRVGTDVAMLAMLVKLTIVFVSDLVKLVKSVRDLAMKWVEVGMLTTLLMVTSTMARERGWLRTLNNWLLQNVPGFPEFFALFEQFAGAIPGQNHPRRRHTYEQRFAKVTSAIQQSPTESYHTHEDLRKLSIHKLKELLQNRKLDLSAAVEREHLIDILLEAGGSTGDACSICLDNYESGDVLRRLSCSHKFHIECVDKWALSALDYSREPACPVCNAVIAIKK